MLTEQGRTPFIASIPRLVSGLATALAAVAIMAPVADAGGGKPERREGRQRREGRARENVEPAPCADRTFAKVFSAWHDNALYTLAGGGDFETQAAGWTLRARRRSRPTARRSCSAPALGASSLELAAGASRSALRSASSAGSRASASWHARSSADQGAVRVQVLYANGGRRSRAAGPAGRRVGADAQALARTGALPRSPPRPRPRFSCASPGPRAPCGSTTSTSTRASAASRGSPNVNCAGGEAAYRCGCVSSMSTLLMACVAERTSELPNFHGARRRAASWEECTR